MNCLSGAVRVNLPSGPFDRRIIAVCGSRSGRDLDKATELGLTLIDGEKVAVPAIAQLPLTLECRVIYRQTEDNALLPPEIRARALQPTRGATKQPAKAKASLDCRKNEM